MYLEKIVKATKERYEERKREISLKEIQKVAETVAINARKNFEEELRKEGMSFICEIKKASPSKGIIAHDFPYLEIAKEYEGAGASGISVLTEPNHFLGSDEYLRVISQNVLIPTLRKDFVLEEYQIYEAKALGASAILLISELLDKKDLSNFLQLAKGLGLSVLTESHSVAAMEKAMEAGACMLGANNRNLETFEVDLNTSVQLKRYAPKGCVFVSESGIQKKEDIAYLLQNGVDAVLIGEALMRSADKQKTIREWKYGK